MTNSDMVAAINAEGVNTKAENREVSLATDGGAAADPKRGDEGTATEGEIHTVDGDLADPNVVDWDGPNDPQNPRTWSRAKKMWNIALVSFSVLYTNIATTMFAPGAKELVNEFHVSSSVVMTLAVTIPSLGAAAGPLLLAPLSEVTGRVPIYRVTSVLYLCFTVGWARSSGAAMFLVFRFFCGACAASFMTCGGGTIADLLIKEERGAATAMFTVGPLLGPVVGPIVGGFVTQAWGWRWTFYLVLMLAGVVTTVAIATMHETNGAIILRKKAAHLRQATGNTGLRPARATSIPPQRHIGRALVRPMRMLFLSPIVMLIGLYLAFVFGMTYLLFATFPTVFEGVCHWTIGVSGLAYLGLGIGCAVGVVVFSQWSDKLLRPDGPERRLLLMIWTGPCVPLSIFWYCWTAQSHIHWIVPIIGTSFVGVGAVCVTSSAQLYMMDTFGPAGAASALAATTLVRNGSGAFLALAADPLYRRLSLGWGNSVFGFIATAFWPMPILFYRYGQQLRARFPVPL